LTVLVLLLPGEWQRLKPHEKFAEMI